MPWQRFGGGFDLLVASTAPAFWLFMLATGASLLSLWRREPNTPRAFHMPFYPLTPLLFIASCLFMLGASVRYAGGLTAVGLLAVALGAPLSALSRSRAATTSARRADRQPGASPSSKEGGEPG